MFRRLLPCLVSAAFLLPAAAHADSFTPTSPTYSDPVTTIPAGDSGTSQSIYGNLLTFTPDSGGVTYSFNLNASGTINSDVFGQYLSYVSEDGNATIDTADSAYSNFASSLGYGFVDARVHDSTSVYYLVGPSLYSGNLQDMQFLQSSYTLAGSSALSSGGGTLTIGASPIVAETPEPSSLALLGTGVLGLAGAVRRRFLTA